MTKGDWIRKIKKESLSKEIQRLESTVRELLNAGSDADETDVDIQAYRAVIAEKKAELENL